MANLLPLTGVDGAFAMLDGTSTVATAEAMSEILVMPGGNFPVVAKKAYMVTARTKKVMDGQVVPVVLNSAVALPSNLYRIHWGAGIIVFYTPLTGTPSITMTYNYLPTATATDVLALPHVNNIQLGLTGNQIQGDEYGTEMIPEYRGKMQGTFQFDYLSSSTNVDLYYRMLQQNWFTFAAWESVQGNRLRILYGDLTGMPLNIPGNGMSGGTITATLKRPPTILNEAL